MTPSQKRSPVMTDVARLAGVSHQTVSRVLNEHPNVKESTRALVLDAIEKLAYRRNSAARALVTRKTNTLGVIAFDTTLYGPASTLYSVEHAAREAGYSISIVSLKTITRQGVSEAANHLIDAAVEALVVIAPQQEAVEALASLPADFPAVAVEGGLAPNRPVVCVDQVGGAAAATRHLLDLGHATVWHVAGPADWLEAEGRISGWRRTLETAGAAAPEPLSGDWSPRSGYEAGRKLLEHDDVTAVFVANDQMALGMLRAFREEGKDVPGDISVAGFDDIPEAAYFTPPLTTVRQDFATVGRRALGVLLQHIDTDPSHRQTSRSVVPAELVVRASTAAPD